LTKEEANAKLAELVAEFEAKLSEAEKLADEHGLQFDIYPAHGMGGTYYGAGHSDLVDDPYLRSDMGIGTDEGGWYSSSQSC
jgi:hypothetical protein